MWVSKFDAEYAIVDAVVEWFSHLAIALLIHYNPSGVIVHHYQPKRRNYLFVFCFRISVGKTDDIRVMDQYVSLSSIFIVNDAIGSRIMKMHRPTGILHIVL
ncbi:hypothetical protein GW17_00008946 [Ensete ventricosum]|nr:hypothetical protein GW17_00008946 [Ensete ventricosum]